MNIPEDFYKLHKFVTLTTDVMFSNGNAFMITPARKLEFATVEHIQSQTSEQIIKSLNKLIKLYGRGGLFIRMILKEMEVEKVAELLVKVEVNLEESREHVEEI